MAVDANVYTEVQHLSLLTSAVERETASLTAEKDGLATELSGLAAEKAQLEADLTVVRTALDVAEAEKASAVADAEAARTELAEFKASLVREKELADLKQLRTATVKTANPALVDGYFSEERQGRWAAMEQAAFDDFVASVTETVKEAAGETGGRELAKETAAFSEGRAPVTGGRTGFLQVVSARRAAEGKVS